MAKSVKLKLPKDSGKENVAPNDSSVKSAPRKNAVWSSADDKTLIDVLTEQQAAGNQADNNWKGVVWVAAALKLQGSEAISGGGPKTADGCDNHWQKLKKDFLIVKELREKSGWGWDAVRHIATAPDSAWDELILANKKMKIWCTKPFPLYDEILPLVEGRHATGEEAFNVGESYDDDIDSAVENDFAGSPLPGLDWSDSDDANDAAGGVDITDAGHTDDEDSEKDNSACTKSRRKRAASILITPASSRKKKKNSRPSGPVAIMDVADALRDVATSLIPSDSKSTDALATPQRCTAAIRVVTKDENLTKEEQVKVMRLFREDMAIADSYLAIDDVETRTAYIHSELDG